ncbi:MFS transporter [Desulfosporosinus sp. OT]|uniref:MFS transporter n=1 Tax=Desulfosporosinus sp. OT TaxID=913865 RepID=UPI000223B284|nr:MFS transporter [Desulfosporosinus sp. OT]EGW38033.1 drug resistance MFS transporter, drug:H+ antiporter-1 family protein [Desulfosporosinus sp. OT]
MNQVDNNISTRVKTSPRYRWYILATVSIGTFMATLDSSIVNVALPTISIKLQADLSILQWVVTAYLLTISSLLPVFGRIADLVGRKRVFSIGFLIFTLGSILCGLATNIWFLIGMRVLQALGASMLMANSAALIIANFPPKERGRALGLTGTVVALGSLTGPALGGVLVGLLSWRSIFYINLPIGILGYLAAQIILPHDNPQQNNETFDFVGALFFTLGMISLLFAVSNGQDWGWQTSPILFGLVIGTILLGLFFYTELRVKNPMIHLSLFRIRPFFIGNITGFLSFVAMYANTMLMPFYLQHVLNYSPTQVGLLMTAFPLMMAVTAPISGHASDRIGPIILTTSGLLVTAVGFLYLSTMTAASLYWQIIPGLLLMGLGAGLFQSPNNSSVMSSVPPNKLGVAGGINALVRNVGMVIGIAYSVSLFENREANFLAGVTIPTAVQQATAFVGAYRIVMLTSMGIAIIAALISLNRKGYTRSET